MMVGIPPGVDQSAMGAMNRPLRDKADRSRTSRCPYSWYSASVFAAMIKSLRCRPLILCVHQVTVTLPHSGMMALFLGQIAYEVGEGERGDEVLKDEDALQPFDAVDFDDVPLWDLGLQPGNFGICQSRLAPTAGGTFQLRQFFHGSQSPSILYQLSCLPRWRRMVLSSFCVLSVGLLPLAGSRVSERPAGGSSVFVALSY